MMKRWKKREGFFLLCCVFLTFSHIYGYSSSPHVKARLMPEVGSIEPGSRFCVALAFTMEEGWHIYWKNPGDSGLPATIQWDLPEGFSAGETEWPYPLKFETPGIVSFGYADDAVYNGGIDDIRSANVHGIAKANNYVRAALEELLSAQEVSVKYKN